jgi:hypothetical protein
VTLATVQPEEEAFEGEPMPAVAGVEVVTGSVIEVPEKKSVWGKVKGWFS